MSDEKMPFSVAVYGAGVSGLIASYYLYKKGFEVDVVDPFGETVLGSLQTEFGVVEEAANSILANDAAVEMLKDIDLDYEYYFNAGKRKYVFLNGKTLKWPLSFKETVLNMKRLFLFVKKNQKMKPNAYETIESWGERVLSKTVIEKLLSPALQGIYGANSKNVSATLAFGHLFKNSNKKKKTSGSLSFPKGMGEFQDGLKKYLIKNGVRFLKEKDEYKNYSHSIVSTPAHSLPDVVSKINKNILDKIDYKKVSTITVFVNEKDRMDFSGFGCVFKGEPKGVLGLILNSDLFDGRAKEGLVSETWILNGEVVFDEKSALNTIRLARSEFFNKESNIVSSYYKYWNKAFPNYDVGLEHALESLEPQKDVDFFANWTGSLGIGSMIKNGDEFSDKILKKVKGL